MGTGGSFLGIKRPEREFNHAFPSSTLLRLGMSKTLPPLLHTSQWCDQLFLLPHITARHF